MRAAHLAAALAMLALCACGSSPIGQPAQTSGADVNVTGTLDRGSIPTCPADEPCDPHAKPFALVFSRPGARDVIVHVATDGSFALHLDPGDYSIAAAPPAFGGEVEPSTVRVPGTGPVVLSLHIKRSS